MNTRMSCRWLNVLRLAGIAIFVMAGLGAPMPAIAGPSQAPSAAPLLEQISWVDEDNDGIDDQFEDQLMNEFAPKVYFHPNEDWFPAAVDWYLQKTSIGWGEQQISQTDPLVQPPLTIDQLLSQTYNSEWSGAVKQAENGQDPFTPSHFFLEISDAFGVETVRHGQKDSTYWNADTGTGSWPVYAHVHPAPSDHPGMIDIAYWFFYPFNGNLGIPVPPYACGNHEGDWENVTIRVDADGDPHQDVEGDSHVDYFAYLAQHSGGDWVKYSDVLKTGDGRPIVFSAWHSHATYRDEGYHTRFAPDRTGYGDVWDTSVHVTNVGEKWDPAAGKEWIQFTGRWGELGVGGSCYPNGPHGPAIKAEWDTTEATPDDDDVHYPPSVYSENTYGVPGGSNQASLYFEDTFSSGPWTVTVNWGDGTIEQWTTTTPGGQAASHTYAIHGRYYGWWMVSNGFTAARNSLQSTVDVKQPGPDYIVNTTGDYYDGVCGVDCTLKDALMAANGDRVDSTISLGHRSRYAGIDLPVPAGKTTIYGNGATVNGGLNQTIFMVSVGDSLVLDQITLEDGGQAIYNSGTVTIRNSTLRDNQAFSGSGGAIYNLGTLTVVNSTFAGNQAGSMANGGAIYNAGTMTMLSSTLASNEAPAGAAIFNKDGATATIKNTIIAFSERGRLLCSGSFAAASTNNLATDDSCGSSATKRSLTEINLGGDDMGRPALADNGGLTKTIALKNPSVAIDAGNGSACLDALIGGRDQRNYTRFVDSPSMDDTLAQCDIGAFEAFGTPLPPAPSPDDTPPAVGIFLTPDTPDGSNGWYRSPVNASVLYLDYESQVIDVRCALDPATPPASFDDLPAETCPYIDAGLPLAADGQHSLYAAAMNEYGNAGALQEDGSVLPFVAASFQIDTTPPVLTCPAAGPFLLNSGDLVAGPAGVDASVSGLDEAASTLSGIVTTESVGPKTLIFTATDLAGNSASLDCTYNVIFDFGGPYPPVAAGLNAVKAGQAVPVKFSLAGDQGLAVLAAAFSQPVACDTLAPIGDPAPAEWAGQSGLSYDPETGWYSVVWKTEKDWGGSCRGLTLELIDGTQHAFYFDFR